MMLKINILKNKYIAFIALIFLCAYTSTFAYTQNETTKQPHATFILVKNSDDSQYFTAKLILNNLTPLPESREYELAFNSIRPIANIDNAKLVNLKQGGDFYIIKFTLPKNSNTISFNLKGQWFIKKYSDAPSGYFLIENPDSKNPQFPPLMIPVKADTQLPPWQPNPDDNEESKNKIKENTSIEGNPIETTLTADTSLIVPLPVELKRNQGQFMLNKETQILYQDMTAKASADFFVNAIKPAIGYLLTIKPYQSDQLLQNTILLTHQGIESFTDKQKKEGYILEVTPTNIIIRADSETGFFYALQSLRQLLPPEIFGKKFQSLAEWKVPCVFIQDYPRFEYRGLHLDVARHFVPADQVKRLIDLMAMHKLNYFEWHLTDDEGWRIEIKQYPLLTQKGAWRGFQPMTYSERDLLPAYGSGAKSYGGFYTQQQIREIVRFAEDRHITIVPEIDLPGHARAMIMSLPNELIDTTDTSSYTSVQGYHDNVLSPCKSETFTVIENILTEVTQLFPGKYIHIGGDEVPQGAWANSCMAKKYNPNDPNFRELVQNEFLKKVQDLITKKGKVMAGWEEIAGENSSLAAPLRVYIWNTNKINQAYKKSAREGYEVIMAPAENLYFDLAYNNNPSEPGLYWAGFTDTFSAYSFKPIDAEQGQSDMIIKGVQGQLWSELIDSRERLDYQTFPKIAGLAELAWTPATRRNWKNFHARMQEKYLPMLDYYGVNYRKNEFIKN